MIKQELQRCRSQTEIERYLDGREMSYSISDNPRDLIEDYAASDAFSEDDVEGLLAMSEEDLIDRFLLCPFAWYIENAGFHIFIFDET